MKNKFELVETLEEKTEYDKFDNEYKNKYLYKVNVVIDGKSWGNIVILETYSSSWGSSYYTLGDWQYKQPETIIDFYNYADDLNMIHLEVDELNGTITDTLTGTVFDATDIL